MKLAIVVDGSNVQSIYTDRPDIPVEIDVIDFDNLRAEDWASEALSTERGRTDRPNLQPLRQGSTLR